MKTKKMIELIHLGQQLATTGAEFRISQIALEKTVEKHGMSSSEAVDAAQLCGKLALHFSQLEEEFLSLEAQILSEE